MANDAFQFDEVSSDAPQKKQGIGCLGGFLIGCGILFLILLIAGGVGGYFLYSFIKQGYSTDPAKIDQWLQEVIECKVPEKYEGKMGLNYSFADFHIKLLILMPVDAALDQDDPGLTRFMVFGGPEEANQRQLEMQFEQQFEQQMQQNPNLKGQGGERVESTKVEVQVGEYKYQATRSVYSTEEDRRVISYMVSPKAGVLVAAFGPEEGFDQEAFDAFLKSMKADPPPVAVEMEEADKLEAPAPDAQPASAPKEEPEAKDQPPAKDEPAAKDEKAAPPAEEAPKQPEKGEPAPKEEPKQPESTAETPKDAPAVKSDE